MNKRNIQNWLKKFENYMAAAAFAEAGEFETAREMLKEERKILLALTGENSDINAFRYAVNMCKRIHAKLEILCSAQYAEHALKRFMSGLKKEGVEYNVTKVNDCIKEEVRTYTNKRSDILFVVVESSEGPELNCNKAKKTVSESWKSLKCPLVVVSDLATA